METRELLHRIINLPVASGALADDLAAGSFSSVFKGAGLEFEEARHYQIGDDARLIDWNASARFGVPFVKMYREERELGILILLDTSASMLRANWAAGEGGGLSPYEQALLATALIAFSAERAGQRAGAFLFDREIERVFPPRKGRRHIMALISAALQYQRREAGRRYAPYSRTDAQGSNLRAALAGAGKFLKRRSLIVVVSDFYALNWEQELADLCRKHDVIALRISDPLDEDLDDLGLVSLEDPETGLRLEAPTGFASFQESWADWHRQRSELWASLCRRSGAAHLELSTSADTPAALFRFFGAYGKSTRHPARQRIVQRGLQNNFQRRER
jgi:uncharacterized protein (DUF58 family)